MPQENDRPTYNRIKAARPTGDHPKGDAQVNNQQHKQTIAKTIEDIKAYLKICHDLSSSYCDVFIRKMTEEIKTIEDVIRSAPAQFDEDSSKISKLFERITASLNAPSARLMNLVVETKRQQLIEAYKILMNNLRAIKLFGETAPITNTNSDYASGLLVRVTAVTNPGKFYVVYWSDMKESDKLFDWIQKLAPLSSVPNSTIVPGQVYAVLNSDKKWFRATVELSCIPFQVGDGPSETLYQCFLLDVGQHERVPKSNMRVLPKELMDLPPFAKECTMNPNFNKHQMWSFQTTTLFKEWTGRNSLMKMKVIGIRDGVLNVDLDLVEEEDQIVFRPSSLVKQFKPKYEPSDLQCNPLKFAVVLITKAAQPNFVYIRIEDEDLPRYRLMQEQLQLEFCTATKQSTSFSPSPVIGHCYAVQCGNLWYRALIEPSEFTGEVVFYVDTGCRQAIQPDMIFHELPEKFFELPAQAVRCALDGVCPPPTFRLNNGVEINLSSYPEEIFYFMARYDGKLAVAVFDRWNAGEVGRTNEARELQARVVMYPYGDARSMNIQVCQTRMARLEGKQIEFPEHYEIRSQLAPQSLGQSSMNSFLSSLICDHHHPLRCVYWKPAELPKIGDTFIAKVTWFTKEGVIYLQKSNSKFELEAIRLYLNSQFEGSSPTRADLICTPGNPCIVRYKNDWYRCTIVSVKGEKVSVYFEDFGSVLEEVDVTDVRLNLDLVQKPVQVLPCTLYNLKPAGGTQEWDTKARNAILIEADKWTFQVTVKAQGPQVTLAYNCNSNFNVALVQNGFADFIN